jgi:hypothetical protein
MSTSFTNCKPQAAKRFNLWAVMFIRVAHKVCRVIYLSITEYRLCLLAVQFTGCYCYGTEHQHVYLIWYDAIRYDDTIRYDMIRCDMLWYDMIRYDTICYMILYDTIRNDIIRYDMIYDTIRNDNTIRYVMIWYYMTRYEMIWYYTIRNDDTIRYVMIWYMIR